MTKKAEERFITIETILSEQSRNIEELNEEIIRQGKLIDRLIIENKALKEAIENPIKSNHSLKKRLHLIIKQKNASFL